MRLAFGRARATTRPARPRPRHGGACRAVRDRAPSANRTISRRVRVPQQEDYSPSRDRFYFNFTGFPFPIGPLLFRKTTRTEVRYLARYRRLLGARGGA
jgi:hypothetical protein